LLNIFYIIIAQRSCKKKYSTLSHKAGIRHGGHTKTKKNDRFNLSLCPLWFLGGFVFEDFFCQKNKDFTCNTIIRKIYSHEKQRQQQFINRATPGSQWFLGRAAILFRIAKMRCYKSVLFHSTLRHYSNITNKFQGGRS